MLFRGFNLLILDLVAGLFNVNSPDVVQTKVSAAFVLLDMTCNFNIVWQRLDILIRDLILLKLV